MKLRANRDFSARLETLPIDVRGMAAYRLSPQIDWHHSSRFKKIGSYWIARVTDDYRALGIESDGTLVWFWIGPHKLYERLLG